MAIDTAGQVLQLKKQGHTVTRIAGAVGLSDYRVRCILEGAGKLRTGWKGPKGYATAIRRRGEIIELRKGGYNYPEIADMLGDPDISGQSVGRIIRAYAPNLSGLQRRTMDITLTEPQYLKLRAVANDRGEQSVRRMVDILIDESVEKASVDAVLQEYM
jgi:transcriptional regulator